VIEIVAERLFCPDEPFPAEQDQQAAEQFARLMCVHPDAIDDFITYARHEARALLNAHAAVVLALAEELLERLTLTGEQIDVVIATALVRADLALERKRRAAAVRMLESAKAFAAIASAARPPQEATR
jgi:hypothetical protein